MSEIVKHSVDSEYNVLSVKANIINIILSVAGLLYGVITFNIIAYSILMYLFNVVFFLTKVLKEFCKKLPHNYRSMCLLFLFIVRLFYYCAYAIFLFIYVVVFDLSLEILEEFSVFYYIGVFLSNIIVEIFAFIAFLPGWIYKKLQLRKH